MKTGSMRVTGTLRGDVWQRVFEKSVLDYADSYTKLLLHCDWLDGTVWTGGGPFFDNEPTAKTVVVGGTAKCSIAQKKFGVSSGLFNGTSDYLSIADSPDWDFGTGAFTVDMWINPSDVTASSCIFESRDSGNLYGISIRQIANHIRIYSDALLITGTATLVNGTWYHVALVGNGGANGSRTIKLYIDGVQDGSTATVDYNYTGTRPIIIGSIAALNAYFYNGYIDEIRVSVGIERWTTGFTPPTAAYDSALSVLDIVGLDGNTDEEYRLICKRFTNLTYSSWYPCFNKFDENSQQYGYQLLWGADSLANAYHSINRSYIGGGYGLRSGEVHYLDYLMYVKSGYPRTIIIKEINPTSGDTNLSLIGGSSWANTTDNITSIGMFFAANSLGKGSTIELYRRLPAP